MTISDEICIIANKLANEGKSPTVALIKSGLNHPVPLPQIIATLKTWQHDPEFIQTQGAEISEKWNFEKTGCWDILKILAKTLKYSQNHVPKIVPKLKIPKPSPFRFQGLYFSYQITCIGWLPSR